MKNLLIALLLAGLGYGGFKAYRHFAPAEKKVYWTVSDAVDAFNERNVEGTMKAFGELWKDETFKKKDEFDDIVMTTVGVKDLRPALEDLFKSKLDEDGKFLYKIEVIEEATNIVLKDPTNATFEMQLNMHVREGFKWSKFAVWRLSVKAKLTRVERGKWVITETTHEAGGQAPF